MRHGKNNFPAPANTPLCVFMCLCLVGKKATWCDSSSSRSLLHSALLETGKFLSSFMDSSATVHFGEVYSANRTFSDYFLSPDLHMLALLMVTYH